MMCPSAEPQDAGIGRGRLPGAGMEQHLAGLARPADGLPVDLVEMAHLAGQMIAPRRLARGVECRIGGRGVGNMLAHGLLSSSRRSCRGARVLPPGPGTLAVDSLPADESRGPSPFRRRPRTAVRSSRTISGSNW